MSDSGHKGGTRTTRGIQVLRKSNDINDLQIGHTGAPVKDMKRILVVDDDAQIVDSLREYLASFGYDVEVASELEEAKALIVRRDYDVIITDLRLSRTGFSGLEIIKQIRTSSRKAQVVVLTGHAWPELEAEASTHGLCVFLQKPVPAWQVLKTINLLTGVSA